MKKLFKAPEIYSVQLAAAEAVMNSLLAEKRPGISYSISDQNRTEAERQRYWSGK